MARSGSVLADLEARIVRTASGGIAVYFFGTDRLPDGSRSRVASLEANAEGEITLMQRDLAYKYFADIPDDLSLYEALEKLETCLSGSLPSGPDSGRLRGLGGKRALSG